MELNLDLSIANFIVGIIFGVVVNFFFLRGFFVPSDNKKASRLVGILFTMVLGYVCSIASFLNVRYGVSLFLGSISAYSIVLMIALAVPLIMKCADCCYFNTGFETVGRLKETRINNITIGDFVTHILIILVLVFALLGILSHMTVGVKCENKTIYTDRVMVNFQDSLRYFEIVGKDGVYRSPADLYFVEIGYALRQKNIENAWTYCGELNHTQSCQVFNVLRNVLKNENVVFTKVK